MTTEALSEFFVELARSGVAAIDRWPPHEDLGVYGLERRGSLVFPMLEFDPLNVADIRAAMSQQALDWLRELTIHPVIGSTNAELMARAQQGEVDGCVSLAELQLQGRGRRGRGWFSPFAGNIAVSIGIEIEGPPSSLGGASLVVGLAVMDALDQLGVPDLNLKWPNDVLLRGAKLGGILIEMIPAGTGVRLVVGIGLNVMLPEGVRARLEHPVADLASVGAAQSRSLLAGRVISSVVMFIDQFQRLGFAPFVEAFNARHHFHHESVDILQGEHRIPGRVSGVSEHGGLLLQTESGPQEFHGGEVSLREGRRPSEGRATPDGPAAPDGPATPDGRTTPHGG